MSTISRGTDAPIANKSWRVSHLHGVSYQDSRDVKANHHEPKNSYVQGAVETPFKEEATWDREPDLKVKFPQLFPDPSESRGWDSF